MCGSTAAQDQLQGEQLQAYQQAQQLTAEQYANQQALYAPMAAQFQSILTRGPNAKGFSDEEEQHLDAQAVEGTAENYEGAAKAVNENLAAEGGGSNPLPSGGQTQLKEQVATSSAQEESREEEQIQQADYSQGYNEWENAGAGLETIAAGENPLGYEGAATSSGSAAGTTAEQIAEEENSWENAAIGAVGTAAGGWATGGFKTP
jgi:hypothetical protein